MSILDRLKGAAVTAHEGIQKAISSGVAASTAEDVAKRFGPEAIHMVAAAAASQPGAGTVAAHVIEVLGPRALAALVDHLEAQQAGGAAATPVAASDASGVSESASVSQG